MIAIDPPLKLTRLSSESRVLRRGSLGDQIDGRSREGRFLRDVERELVAHVGGKPTVTQKLLIRRLARGLLRLELLDERITRGELNDHDARTFIGAQQCGQVDGARAWRAGGRVGREAAEPRCLSRR